MAIREKTAAQLLRKPASQVLPTQPHAPLAQRRKFDSSAYDRLKPAVGSGLNSGSSPTVTLPSPGVALGQPGFNFGQIRLTANSAPLPATAQTATQPSTQTARRQAVQPVTKPFAGIKQNLAQLRQQVNHYQADVAHQTLPRRQRHVLARKAQAGAWASQKLLISSGSGVRVQGIFGKIGKALGKAFDWVKEQVVKPIKRAAEALLNGLKQQVKSFVNGLKSTAQTLLKSAKKGVTSLINAVKRQVQRLVQQAKAVILKLMQQGKRLATQLAKQAQRAAQRIMAPIRKRLQGFVQKMLKLAQHLVRIGNPKRAQDLLEKIRKFASKQIDSARQRLTALVQSVSSKISKLLSQIPQKINQVAQKVTGSVQKLGTNLTSQANRLVNTATQGAERAIQQAAQAVPRMFQAAKNRLGGILGPARGVANWLIDQLNGAIQGLLNTVLLPMAKAVGGAIRKLIQPFLQLANQILQKATSFIGGLIQKLVQKATQGMQTIIAWIKRKLDELVLPLIGKVLEAFATLLKGIVNGVLGVIEKLILEPLKAFMTFMELLMQLIARAGGVLDKILEHPVRFIQNLFAGVGQGLGGFGNRILTHLEKGLQQFLLGPVADAGLKLPRSFDLEGIFSLVAQAAGLTYDRLRGLAVGQLGETNVGLLEQAGDFGSGQGQSQSTSQPQQTSEQQTGDKPPGTSSAPAREADTTSPQNSEAGQPVQDNRVQAGGAFAQAASLLTAIKSGPEGLVGILQNLDLGSLVSMVMDGIKDYLIQEIITKAIIQISAYLVPGAGWLKAAIDAFRVMYALFIQRAEQMADVVNGFSESIVNAANGAVAGAANRLETALGKSIPMLIGVLADYLGIGGLPAKIQNFIARGQGWINENVIPFIEKIFAAVAGVLPRGQKA